MRKYLISILLIVSCCSISFAQFHKIDPSFREEMSQRKERLYQKMMLSEKMKTPNQENYDIKYYSLDLIPDPKTSVLSGVVNIVGEVVATTLDHVELNFWDGMSITNVHKSNFPTVQLNYRRNNDILTIDLDTTYIQGDQFSLVIAYNGKPQNSYYRSFSFDTYSGKPMIWTMSEPFGARAWWPCKDVPSDKADSVDIRVTVPSDLIVASNGTLREKTTQDEKTTYWWHEGYPIVTYLVSLAIHPYTVTYDDYLYNNDSDTMKIHFYMFPDHANELSELNAIVKEMIASFSDMFGEYPFVKEKYGHADFLWGGAMEHQTCTSFAFWGEWVYAHELAHQWWGDMITCNSFHHIWLNEGFASYSEALWFEHVYGPGAANWYQMQANLYLGPGTVYVEDPENESIFHGGLSYNKASWVLHMLRHVVGDSVFFDILKTYYASPNHQYGTATTEDFQAICEEVSGLDLDTFFRQWIYESYFPIYSTIWATFQDSVVVFLQQTQKTGTIFQMPVDIQVICTDTSFISVVENSQSNQLYKIPIPNGQSVLDIVIDPGNWILKQISLPPRADVIVPGYVEPESEGIEIMANFNDVIPFTVNDAYATISRYDSIVADTIQLYDDGDHGDVNPVDGIFGGYGTVGSGEYIYLVDVFAVDSIGLVFSYFDVARFTTIGPVVYDGIQFLTDTIPNPGDNLVFKVFLKNDGQIATASDISVELNTDDTCAIAFEIIGRPEYGDIPVGEIAITDRGGYLLEISDSCPVGSDITFQLSIASGGYFFWSDSFTIHVEPLGIVGEDGILPDEFVLHQNYPNPFNPVTTMKYDLPKRSYVVLTIYDILGREVRTLIKGVEEPGFKSVVWDGTNDLGNPVSAGVYLYQINTGEFTQVRKMILLK